jgi:Uma2 family endonuclease
MRVVMLQVPERLLAERRRTGADTRDEMWDGVLRMVPLPSSDHQALGAELLLALAPLAKARGLRPFYETGVFGPDPARDYRVPDLLFARPEHVTPRGVEGGCEVVIELLSPGDETYDKLPFYAAVGVREVLVIDPATRRVDLFVLRGGRLHVALPLEDGGVRSEALGVTFTPAPGPKVRLVWDGGAAEV